MLSEWKFSPCASSMLASLLFQIKLFSIILELTFTLCCLASCILIKLFSVILEVFWPSCMLIKILSIILELTFSPCCFAFLCVDCWVFICPFCCIKRRFHKYLYIWGEFPDKHFNNCRRNVSATKKSKRNTTEIQEKSKRNDKHFKNCRRNISATKKSKSLEFSLCWDRDTHQYSLFVKYIGLLLISSVCFSFVDYFIIIVKDCHLLLHQGTFLKSIWQNTPGQMCDRGPLFVFRENLGIISTFYDNCYNHCSANKISPFQLSLKWQLSS